MIICGILFAAVERDYKHWSLGHRAVVVVVDIFSAFFPFFYFFFFGPKALGFESKGPVSRLGAIEALLLGASYRQEAIIAHWNGFGFAASPRFPPLPLFHHAEWPWYWEKPPLLTPFL